MSETNTPRSSTLDIRETAEMKMQPWKAFWPPKLEQYTQEQLDDMPWLRYDPDPEKPDTKPWYDWMRQDPGKPGIVFRRGAD